MKQRRQFTRFHCDALNTIVQRRLIDCSDGASSGTGGRHGEKADGGSRGGGNGGSGEHGGGQGGDGGGVGRDKASRGGGGAGGRSGGGRFPDGFRFRAEHLPLMTWWVE